MSAGKRLRQQGFTLLELLIALTLLGLILVLLFGGLRLGMRSWDVSQKQVDNLNSVRSLEHFLRREISVAHPYEWMTESGKRLAFLGERHTLSFIAPLPARTGTGGLYAISVELLQTANSHGITLKQLPLSLQMTDFSAVQQVAPTAETRFDPSDIEEIWFTYFGRESGSAEPRWLDRWASASRLPMLIRVQIKLSNRGEQPDFVVAPMLSPGLEQ